MKKIGDLIPHLMRSFQAKSGHAPEAAYAPQKSADLEIDKQTLMDVTGSTKVSLAQDWQDLFEDINTMMLATSQPGQARPNLVRLRDCIETVSEAIARSNIFAPKLTLPQATVFDLYRTRASSYDVYNFYAQKAADHGAPAKPRPYEEFKAAGRSQGAYWHEGQKYAGKAMIFGHFSRAIQENLGTLAAPSVYDKFQPKPN